MGTMRALFPYPEDDVDVHARYADGWLDGGGLRADFVSSVDGAVTVAGLSRGLQTRGDNQVFAALRDLADVVLVGGGTARAEGYAAAHPGGERLSQRRRFGLAPVLPTAVVSRSLRLDPAAPLFTDADSDARTIVITCEAGDAVVRAELERVADVIACGDQDVELGAAREALERRGLRRILCEGGPTLFADLCRAGVVDELCLSLTPFLAGPGPGRITAGAIWPVTEGELVRLRLAALLEEDGALFCRYAVTD